VRRMQVYAVKALHEAKAHSSWRDPNREYDEAVKEFVRLILDRRASRLFLEDLLELEPFVRHFGLLNALSQTLLKLASPGVPDTYQGTEIWDFSLVDPDNRRPVDYRPRRKMLRGLRSAIGAADGDLKPLCYELLARKEDRRIKLYLHHRGLECRRAHPGLFSAGEYLPLAATGPKAEHIFAFARRFGAASAVVAVPRLWARLAVEPARPPLGRSIWKDTRLSLAGLDPSVCWRNIFTGETISGNDHGTPLSLPAAVLFAHFPVALLVSDRPGA
jgi:(1->4)-alpha-D-glucan 1-alpha-D-glucosylmutase